MKLGSIFLISAEAGLGQPGSGIPGSGFDIGGIDGDTYPTEWPSCPMDTDRDSFDGGEFPKDFIWSFATAAYQIEGGWDQDGKGENIWDRFSHQNLKPDEYREQKAAGTFVCPEDGAHVYQCDNGDVACDSYNQMDRDIQLMKDLGVHHYRFSLAWARLCPTGYCTVHDSIEGSGTNELGIQHYKDFIAKLKAADIEPFVTLYHWDLPQGLQDERGGWADTDADSELGINTAFKNYAKLCFESFGDNVKQWITFNEAQIVADLGYADGIFAPGIRDDLQRWRARHNTVRSHTEAVVEYRKYQETNPGGIIGITINTDHYAPATNSAADVNAADLQFEMQMGYWAEPIYGSGDYPDQVKKVLKVRFDADAEKRPLPEFNDAQVKLNQDYRSDFFGLNHYTTSLISRKPNCDAPDDSQCLEFRKCANWQIAGSSWLKKVPYGFGDLLRTIDYKYDSEKYPIYVTENGLSSNHRDNTEANTNGTDINPNFNDEFRVDFYHQYIGQMKKAMDDGVVVKAYTAWSLLDNFEWASGYSERFGLHWVNYTLLNENPDTSAQVAFQKESAKWFGNLATTNTLETFEPNSNSKEQCDKQCADEVYECVKECDSSDSSCISVCLRGEAECVEDCLNGSKVATDSVLSISLSFMLTLFAIILF